MEKTIKNIFRNIDNKKITIEAETIEGGCIAVPAFIIKGNHQGEDIISKSIDIEVALDNFLNKIKKIVS
jgi:hypothetical protein